MRWLRGVLGGAASDGATRGLDPGLQTLLDDHLLPAFDRQLAFAAFAGDRDWDLDQDAGHLRLGDDLVLPAQILGTVSEATSTWRWSWANPSVDEALTLKAREALEIGRERGIGVLTAPDVDLARIGDGHVLALAVAGLLDADAYYRCPYDGGEAFVLVTLPQVREAMPEPAAVRAVSVISEALLGLPVPITKAAIAGYLRDLALPVSESSREVRIDDDSATRFRFDPAGRLTGIGATRIGDDAPADVQPPPQGTSLDAWADPALESEPDWLDAAGNSQSTCYAATSKSARPGRSRRTRLVTSAGRRCWIGWRRCTPRSARRGLSTRGIPRTGSLRPAIRSTRGSSR